MNENFKASKVHRLAHIGMMFGMFSNTYKVFTFNNSVNPFGFSLLAVMRI